MRCSKFARREDSTLGVGAPLSLTYQDALGALEVTFVPKKPTSSVFVTSEEGIANGE
jgi:hypothetical protein